MEANSYIVYINNLNYARSPFIRDATREIKVTKEEYLKVQRVNTAKAWKWDEELNTFLLVDNPNNQALRLARKRECFELINRSPLWFNSLTAEQQQELQEWYQAWLDVTETKAIPSKPTWLK